MQSWSDSLALCCEKTDDAGARRKQEHQVRRCRWEEGLDEKVSGAWNRKDDMVEDGGRIYSV